MGHLNFQIEPNLQQTAALRHTTMNLKSKVLPTAALCERVCVIRTFRNKNVMGMELKATRTLCDNDVEE